MESKWLSYSGFFEKERWHSHYFTFHHPPPAHGHGVECLWPWPELGRTCLCAQGRVKVCNNKPCNWGWCLPRCGVIPETSVRIFSGPALRASIWSPLKSKKDSPQVQWTSEESFSYPLPCLRVNSRSQQILPNYYELKQLFSITINLKGLNWRIYDF